MEGSTVGNNWSKSKSLCRYCFVDDMELIDCVIGDELHVTVGQNQLSSVKVTTYRQNK